MSQHRKNFVIQTATAPLVCQMKPTIVVIKSVWAVALKIKMIVSLAMDCGIWMKMKRDVLISMKLSQKLSR
jgi:hypothetical protein